MQQAINSISKVKHDNESLTLESLVITYKSSSITYIKRYLSSHQQPMHYALWMTQIKHEDEEMKLNKV